MTSWYEIARRNRRWVTVKRFMWVVVFVMWVALNALVIYSLATDGVGGGA